jgi:hypothetical protein
MNILILDARLERRVNWILDAGYQTFPVIGLFNPAKQFFPPLNGN